MAMMPSADKTGRRDTGFFSRRERIRRLCITSLMAALALVLGFIESSLSLPLTIPGCKLGLSNAAILIALYTTDAPGAFCVMCVKVLASGFLFGSPTMIAYSLGGSLLAFLGMWLIKRIPGISVAVVSMGAALLHCLGQLLVASLYLGSGIIFINFLLLALPSALAGLFVGLVAGELIGQMTREAYPHFDLTELNREGLLRDPGDVPEAGALPDGVPAASKIAVIGANGSGKTALLLALQEYFEQRTHKSAWAALCFQNAEDQVVAARLKDDCAFGLENQGCPPDIMEARVTRALQAVELLGHEDDTVFALSGGELQRLAVAGLSVCEPELYLFDEVSSMLDAPSRQRLYTLMDELASSGKTVMFSTQLLEEALNADVIVFIDKLSVLWTGSPLEFLDDPCLVAAAQDRGLCVPQILDLAYKLKSAGFGLPLTADAEVLEEAIWRLYAQS